MNYVQGMIVPYYLRANQYISVCWRYFWAYFFNVKDLKVYSNGKTYGVTWRYFWYNQLTGIISFFTGLREKLNISADRIHMTKITNEGDKTIILQKRADDIPVTLGDVSYSLHNMRPDESMLNCIFINFDLVNMNDDAENKICLKDYMIKYKDTDEQHSHTLENIFIFNNIPYSENSKIVIKVAKNRKISTHELQLKDVNDKHINYFINL